MRVAPRSMYSGQNGHVCRNLLRTRVSRAEHAFRTPAGWCPGLQAEVRGNGTVGDGLEAMARLPPPHCD